MKILLGFLLAVFGCTACAATPVVAMSPLNKVYERQQPVPLTVKNVGKSAIRVYCDLEVLEHGEWVAWPFRVEDGQTDVISIIYPLAPGDSTNVRFDMRKVALSPIPAGQHPKIAEMLTFRFRVVVLNARTDDIEGEFLSSPFVIKRPYG